MAVAERISGVCRQPDLSFGISWPIMGSVPLGSPLDVSLASDMEPQCVHCAPGLAGGDHGGMVW